METSTFIPVDIAGGSKITSKVLDQTQVFMENVSMTAEEMAEIMTNYDDVSESSDGLKRISSLEPFDINYQKNPGIAGNVDKDIEKEIDIFSSPLNSLPSSHYGSPQKSLSFDSVATRGNFSLINSGANSLRGSFLSSRVPSLTSSPEKLNINKKRKKLKAPTTLNFTDDSSVKNLLNDVARAITPLSSKAASASGQDSDLENQSEESNVAAVVPQRVDSRSPIVNAAVLGKRTRGEFEFDENPTPKRIGEAFGTCKGVCDIKDHKWLGMTVWKCEHCVRMFKNLKNLKNHLWGKRGHECTLPGNEQFGIIDGVRVIPKDFEVKKYACPCCTFKCDEKRQLHDHFCANGFGVCKDHTGIDFSCLCPKRGKKEGETHNQHLTIVGATTKYVLSGKVVEVLNRDGEPCEREKNEENKFIDGKGRVLQLSGLPIQGEEDLESDSSDGSDSENDN